MKKTILFFLLIFLISSNGICGSGYGTTGAQILNLNSSARVSAMGNAYAGLADDLNAIIYNPAGLTQLFGFEFQFTRLIYFLGTGMSSFTYGQKLGNIGFGCKLKLFNAKDTYRDSFGYNEEDFDIKYYAFFLYKIILFH